MAIFIVIHTLSAKPEKTLGTRTRWRKNVNQGSYAKIATEMKISWLPKARKKDLLVETIDNEVLVYDLRNSRAHCLNKNAAFVWHRCNGRTSIRELAGKLQKEIGAKDCDQLLAVALRDLSKADLLQQKMPSAGERESISRRDLIRRIGIAAATIPAVTSILVPTAQAAGSCMGFDKNSQAASNRGACCCNGKTATFLNATKSQTAGYYCVGANCKF
jgi:hypothetical protein